MQTNSLQNLLSTTGPATAQRNGNGNNADNAQGGASFGAMLSNEMALRQPEPAPAPAPVAPKADAPKPQAADKPAQPDDAAPQAAAKTEDASKPASADKADQADAKDADSEDGSADEQSAQAGDPANAMLALMASLQQPAQATPAGGKAGAAAQAFDALGGAAGKGKRGDAAQLAVLQTALKSIARDGGAAAGKTFSDTKALSNPALAAAGAGLAADDKRLAVADTADKAGFDPRALGLKGGPVQADAALDAAALALQQARETASAREPVAIAGLTQAQPAVMQAVQAAAAAADELSAQVGTEAWENQVGQKVVYMVGSEEQTASLTLNPPDLGPLQVVLSVNNDQASVTFSANQEEVRQALENALPRLREMMSESGIALGNATVNAGMPDNRQAQEQAARNNGGFGGNGNGNGRGRGDDGNAADEPAARTVTRTAVLGDRGMVDTFA